MTNFNNADSEYFKRIVKYMHNVTDFKEELHEISKTWDQLILLSQLGSTGMDMSETKLNFNNLTTELISHLALEILKKVTNEMQSKSTVTIDILIRNLFERTADIGFLATDEDIRIFLINRVDITKRVLAHQNDTDDTNFRIAKNDLKLAVTNLKKRFAEYVAKYSVYDNVILFDIDGNVVVSLDESHKIEKSTDDILHLAKTTTNDYCETYKYHDFLPHIPKSLVYTYKVKKSNESDELIGFLSLCFKFEDEMESIFGNLICQENKEVILLLDSSKKVIASSDIYHIPINAKVDIELEQPFKITQFAGRDYIIKTSKTNGYEGFYGLGWMGHIMIPLDSAFNSYKTPLKIDEKILFSIMQNTQLFKKELLEVSNKATHIQNQLDRAVWNGNILTTNSKTGNGDFTRSILREVRYTGERTKELFNYSIEKLNETIITSLLDNAKFLASLSIDIMDRNLYERANDCRWWALTSTFKNLLAKETLEDSDRKQMSNILEYINGLYTVYTNLFLYDKEGTILAVSNRNENKLVDIQLGDNWINKTVLLKDSSKYAVSNFDKTFLYNNKHTYIYNAPIFKTSNTQSIGGIGIVFDATIQFQNMLRDALPQIKGEIVSGIFSLFVEKNTKKIISCSDTSHCIGSLLELEKEFFNLENGAELSKITPYKGKYYIVGAKCSSGYREYKSSEDDYKNDILAFVFFECGEITDTVNIKKEIKQQYYDYPIAVNDEIEEIATFYIGDKWLGVRQSEIVEAISAHSLEAPISTDTKHHFKGTVFYKNYVTSVLDINSFIKNTTENKKNEIVLVAYAGSIGNHTVGILVDKLGEIIKIPKSYIQPFEKHLIGGGMLGESIVQPPEGTKAQSLLTLLNIAKIADLGEE